TGNGLTFIGAASGYGLTVAPAIHLHPTSSRQDEGACPLVITRPDGSTMRIRFALSFPVRSRVAIYDVAGRQVAQLVDGALGSGVHEIEWRPRADGSNVRPGIYFARLDAGTVHASAKLVVF